MILIVYFFVAGLWAGTVGLLTGVDVLLPSPLPVSFWMNLLGGVFLNAG